ncbi:hypothetical protein ACFE04_029274 [Oxalis oulophora]
MHAKRQKDKWIVEYEFILLRGMTENTSTTGCHPSVVWGNGFEPRETKKLKTKGKAPTKTKGKGKALEHAHNEETVLDFATELLKDSSPDIYRETLHLALPEFAKFLSLIY